MRNNLLCHLQYRNNKLATSFKVMKFCYSFVTSYRKGCAVNWQFVKLTYSTVTLVMSKNLLPLVNGNLFLVKFCQ